MNIQDKKEMRLAIGEVFEEVILPVIQDVRDDVSELKTDMKSVENRLDRIERKQDAEIERHDNLSQVVEKHDKILINLNKA